MKSAGSIMLQIPGETGDSPIQHFFLVKAERPLAAPPTASRPPYVEAAIVEVIKAFTRLEDSHNSRSERAARFALERAARKLRLAHASDKPFPKKG
ncbi:hypothetical protein [Rhizobium mayense]|uniref:Uncharacterized protein n=1 Tax=Rhizobium mayense TaxID=1312184 RepID=A0ABT7JY54_9HYPH|nr:hypothetical protein [Rhizobium mayense]MDL2401281.1 hypothetical protein [Rhizobium mayense]